MSDLSGARNFRLERHVRRWGNGLLLSAPLVNYAANSMAMRYSMIDAAWVLSLASNGLAQAGAVLLAVSLVVRGLTCGVTAGFVRMQLLAGVGLLVLSVVNVLYDINNAFAPTEYLELAVPGTAAFWIRLMISLTALPLGVALLATTPLYRLAQLRNSTEGTT